MSFSIVIPCFNNETTLGRTLDSVLTQRAFLKEVILIDDGSSDGTAGIAQQYIERYPGLIHYHYQPNSGPARARNHGARLATGDYTLFLDSDDALREGALEVFHTTFQTEPDRQLLIAGYCAVHETHRKERFTKAYATKEQLIKGIWFGEFSIVGSMVPMRTHVLRTMHYPETIRHGEDIVFFSHLIAQYGARILPFIAVDIHHHASSLRHQQTSILNDQDNMVSLLFDPRYLSPALMAHQTAFHARKLISLAQAAVRLKQKSLARQFLWKAFTLNPQRFLSFKTLKICLRTC